MTAHAPDMYPAPYTEPRAPCCGRDRGVAFGRFSPASGRPPMLNLLATLVVSALPATPGAFSACPDPMPATADVGVGECEQVAPLDLWYRMSRFADVDPGSAAAAPARRPQANRGVASCDAPQAPAQLPSPQLPHVALFALPGPAPASRSLAFRRRRARPTGARDRASGTSAPGVARSSDGFARVRVGRVTRARLGFFQRVISRGRVVNRERRLVMNKGTVLALLMVVLGGGIGIGKLLVKDKGGAATASTKTPSAAAKNEPRAPATASTASACRSRARRRGRRTRR